MGGGGGGVQSLQDSVIGRGRFSHWRGEVQSLEGGGSVIGGGRFSHWRGEIHAVIGGGDSVIGGGDSVIGGGRFSHWRGEIQSLEGGVAGGRTCVKNADSVYLFCHYAQYKKGMLSQHFVMHVVPPLGELSHWRGGGGIGGELSHWRGGGN